ncbi:hypothetical protein [Phenylobacterium montanum]|uniref:Uncharacterized protein n=1 Tax=Phenylobacterium montanum TaxID=2823693 RepID=A0A975IT07_9CAUL|nr:hypothetical protein [Caulobacter sp. S6]QUD85979.1 hypothetical protein KCG34_12760 [Caulobacter sp. S6]
MTPILRRWGAAALALLAAGPALADSAPTVALSPDQQRRLGVAAKPLAAAHHVKKTDAFAKVLDPEPLVQLASDLATAEAAARASSAEAKRARALQVGGAAMAAKDAEAAIAQAESDALHVDMLRRRLDLEWGPGVARMSPAKRRRLIDGLTAGKIALVHVDTHNNEGQAGARKVEISVGPDNVPGTVLGPTRAAEPRLQSSGLLVEVDGPSAILLSVGLTQSAEIDSPDSVTGVDLPRGAIVRMDGGDWAYVRTSDSAFERRRVDQPEGDDDGLFVASGFKPGDQVVVQGAAALLAAETGRGRSRP